MSRPLGHQYASPARRAMSDGAQALQWPTRQSSTSSAQPQYIDMSASWCGSVTSASERHKLCHFATGAVSTVGGYRDANAEASSTPADGANESPVSAHSLFLMTARAAGQQLVRQAWPASTTRSRQRCRPAASQPYRRGPVLEDFPCRAQRMISRRLPAQGC
jgi:hypothetical protein